MVANLQLYGEANSEIFQESTKVAEETNQRQRYGPVKIEIMGWSQEGHSVADMEEVFREESLVVKG